MAVEQLPWGRRREQVHHTSRKIFLTQIIDPAGNALSLTYDANLRITAITDAIGQVTTLNYAEGTNVPNTLLTRVTDPFGRSASFIYEKRTISIQRGILIILFLCTLLVSAAPDSKSVVGDRSTGRS